MCLHSRACLYQMAYRHLQAARPLWDHTWGQLGILLAFTVSTHLLVPNQERAQRITPSSTSPRFLLMRLRPHPRRLMEVKRGTAMDIHPSILNSTLHSLLLMPNHTRHIWCPRGLMDKCQSLILTMQLMVRQCMLNLLVTIVLAEVGERKVTMALTSQDKRNRTSFVF
jgi:hypothetical protein